MRGNKINYKSFGSYDEEESPPVTYKEEERIEESSVWKKVLIFSAVAVVVGLCTLSFPLSSSKTNSNLISTTVTSSMSGKQSGGGIPSGSISSSSTTDSSTTITVADLTLPLSSITESSGKSAIKSTTNGRKPNFIFILADDLGYSSIGYEEYDISFASPFLTNMAKSGILMTNYYAQEICTPSRASLLTGRYPITLGMQFEELQTDVNWGLNLTEVLLPEVLRDYGNYKSYALGKWNLGHFTPKLLPTARGFDEYLGYLAGQNYYWSKHMPNQESYQDFTLSTLSCYEPYSGADINDYSTFLYRDKAVRAIKAHDYAANPMFMYMAFQAVHDPFNDYDKYEDGLPPSYLGEELYAQFTQNIAGRNRQQYAMALKLMDSAVESMVSALVEVGQMDNTYIIFASDNGGCYQAGGRNGELRGTKGSLWEGGVKVDSFIYSPLLDERVRGSTYGGIMHVSDWMPTMLELAGIDYTPAAGHAFDGYSQVSAMTGLTAKNPREFLVYNMYLNVQKQSFSMFGNAALAVRNYRYKLIHAFINNPSSKWYSFAEPNTDDWDYTSGSCPQFLALVGGYTYFLFDLQTDPNETKNLYNIAAYSTIKDTLYKQLEIQTGKSRLDVAPSNVSVAAETTWAAFGNVIGPWSESTEDSALSSVGKSFPQRCPGTKSIFA